MSLSKGWLRAMRTPGGPGDKRRGTLHRLTVMRVLEWEHSGEEWRHLGTLAMLHCRLHDRSNSNSNALTTINKTGEVESQVGEEKRQVSSWRKL